MEPQPKKYLETPAPGLAVAAVVGFFVIPSLLDAFAFLGKTPISSQLSVVIFFGTAVLLYVLPLGIGVANRMPRWSLVYLGVGVGIVGIYVVRIAVEILFRTLLMYWMELVLGAQTLPARLLWQWFNQGRFWFSIAMALALFIGLLALLPRFRSLAKRFWGDYSLISFVFYGAVLIIFAIDFDEYRHDEFYQLGCMMALATGAWGHLRIKTPGKRTLALFLGVTVCMAIMGVGKYILVPQQDWPIWSANHPPEAERWFETLRTIATWFWAALAVGLPGFVQSLRKDRPDLSPYVSSPAR